VFRWFIQRITEVLPSVLSRGAIVFVALPFLLRVIRSAPAQARYSSGPEILKNAHRSFPVVLACAVIVLSGCTT